MTDDLPAQPVLDPEYLKGVRLRIAEEMTKNLDETLSLNKELPDEKRVDESVIRAMANLDGQLPQQNVLNLVLYTLAGINPDILVGNGTDETFCDVLDAICPPMPEDSYDEPRLVSYPVGELGLTSNPFSFYRQKFAEAVRKYCDKENMTSKQFAEFCWVDEKVVIDMINPRGPLPDAACLMHILFCTDFHLRGLFEGMSLHAFLNELLPRYCSTEETIIHYPEDLSENEELTSSAVPAPV